ncbi:hypothetical protein AB0O76_40825 [Streptomyces sp. NPDC086554]|uniref:hypothetical protein n=1 Tax=Streptomyces sp. NPDC086554 TaxID=3154864 RepID=UPI00344135E0
MNDDKNTDGFAELMDNLQTEMNERVLGNAAELGLKTARLTGLIIKEAKEWGCPRDLAEAMGADFWQLIMIAPQEAEAGA